MSKAAKKERAERGLSKLPAITEAELDAAPKRNGERAKNAFDGVTVRNAFEDARGRNVIGEHPTHKRGHRVKARIPEGECEILGEHAPGWLLVGVETESGDVCIYPIQEQAILRRVPEPTRVKPGRVDDTSPGPGVGVGSGSGRR